MDSSDLSENDHEDEGTSKNQKRKREIVNINDEVFHAARSDSLYEIVATKEIIPDVCVDFRENVFRRLTNIEFKPLDRYACEWKVKSYHGRVQYVRKLSSILREKLLKRNWYDAAEIVNGLSLITSLQADTDEVMWKVGLEVLYNHPLSSLMMIADHMDNCMCLHGKSGSIDHVEIVFEYMLMLFVTRDFSRALEIGKTYRNPYKRRIYSSIFHNTLNRVARWEPVAEAYIGLALYLQWEQVLVNQNEIGADHEDADQLSQNASARFDKIVDIPGIWDNFVLKQVVILKRCEKLRKLKQFLQTYVDKNPSHSNAIIYLYEFLEEYDTSDKIDEKINLLIKLKDLNPTHVLLLKLCENLSAADGKTLATMMDLLEHEKWKQNVEMWAKLALCLRHLNTEDNRKKFKSILKINFGKERNLSDRASWWPQYFFSKYEYNKDVSTDASLVAAKFIVATNLKLKKCGYFKEARTKEDIDTCYKKIKHLK